jgi:hypothetical protein
VECKTSRSDFYADRRKYIAYHEHQFGWRYAAVRITAKEAQERGYTEISLPRMGDFRFYMCEADVLPVDLVTKHAPEHGLIYVEGTRRVRIVIPATRREAAMIDKDSEIRYLRFAIINNKTPEVSNVTLPVYGDPLAGKPVATSGDCTQRAGLFEEEGSRDDQP